MLENAQWNFDDNTVSLSKDDGFDDLVKYTTYEALLAKLIQTAEETYNLYLPLDAEFAEEQKEKFDAEDLVNSHLSEYDENLTKLGWI
ncbi:MAG: hypothetical protein M0D57_02880 [Sphingobacteriales bacterium JAD_PAG50586_3]|nr:MAG: hypothetical protein M0D57_02880 [Sphingobacteriales bacterium JAD_PAG50586_3]